jgi:hypothetical protein
VTVATADAAVARRGIARIDDRGTLARIALVVAALALAFWPTVVALATGSMPGATVGQGIVAMGLVAVGIAAGVQDRRPHRVNIHDREMDAIVGSLLLVTSLGLTWFLPTQMGDLVALYRPDLLGAAAFLAGALCLTVGVRTACRCWPALLGLVVVHPVLVELALQPVMRGLAAAGTWLAGWVVGAQVATEGEAAITVWLTHSGSYQALDLTEAVGAFSWVPLALVVLIASAVVLHGRTWHRIALVAVGTATVLAGFTLRIVVGVVVARAIGVGEHTWVLGGLGTVIALEVALVASVLAARALGLTWGAPGTVAAPAEPGRRLSLPVATGILGAATVLVALLASPVDAEVASLHRSAAVADADLGLATVGPLVAVSRTVAPSPYPAVLATGDWRRTQLTALGAAGSSLASGTPSDLVLDVIDARDADLLALYPPREVYGGVAHAQAVSRPVPLTAGLDGVATTYLDANGRPVMTTLSWAWVTSDGQAQLLTLSRPDAPGTGVPVPRVDLAGSLLPNILGDLRGATFDVPPSIQAELDAVDAELAERASQVISDLEAG